jgi:hypothetical protein
MHFSFRVSEKIHPSDGGDEVEELFEEGEGVAEGLVVAGRGADVAVGHQLHEAAHVTAEAVAPRAAEHPRARQQRLQPRLSHHQHHQLQPKSTDRSQAATTTRLLQQLFHHHSSQLLQKFNHPLRLRNTEYLSIRDGEFY